MATYLVQAQIDLVIVADNEQRAEELLLAHAPHCTWEFNGESVQSEEGTITMTSIEEDTA